MRVRVVAATEIFDGAMHESSGRRWVPEQQSADASALAEFAGRACYQSWTRPNPTTASNHGYVQHIIEMEHFSVIEHATVTVSVEDVSRSFTHELVRHRHFSFSQLSQRFVPVEPGSFVVPPLYGEEKAWEAGHPDTETQRILETAWNRAVVEYERLVAIWMPRLIQRGYSGTMARKMAREAARSVLPNMAPTQIIVTGNHRSWRELLAKRGSIHADAEIRQFALIMFEVLRTTAPPIYADFEVTTQDGQDVVGVRR